jgi:hypothetical protein
LGCGDGASAEGVGIVAAALQAPTALAGVMPPYRKAILSDADLADIYAYLQSIPKPPDVKSVPLLNQWASKPQ